MAWTHAVLFVRLPTLVLLVALSACAFSGVTASAVAAAPADTFATVNPRSGLTAGQAKSDVRILKRALSTLHPALTKYRSQAEIDAAFARFEARGGAARTATEMYLAASELAAAIRCGHTWTNVLNQEGAVKAALLESANKLPFLVTLVEGRWLVLASVNAAVAVGDEVVAINGLTATEMVAMLMPYLRADGGSDGKRLRQLNHDRADYSQMDILWPLLSPPIDGQYRVRTRQASGVQRDATVRAITLDAPIDESWRFAIEGDTAYMTLPTFSIRNSKLDWREFFNKSIVALNAKSIPTLVIDIRDNEGGDGAIGGRLLSYFLTEPLKYRATQAITMYERVPYQIAKYLDTWDYSFFDRTGQVERLTDGTAAGKFLVTARAKFDRELMPNPLHYHGNVFVLVGPENSSASFQFADLAKRSGRVTLVGQSTGGNQRGLNGGELAWVTLPNSGVAVDIPLLAAAYTATTPDTSVAPDIVVERTFEAKRRGEDLEMDAVKLAIAVIKVASQNHPAK
jgi:C-terminal processing protease CtpA/Prc